jgi:hypothetical protein
MRVIVAGSRSERRGDFVYRHLDRIDRDIRIDVVIEGGQRKREDGIIVGGVDFHAMRWAVYRGRVFETFEANWYPRGRLFGYDKSAGPKRNQRMLYEGRPDAAIIFPGGTGTANMEALARRAGIEVIKIEDEP